MLVPIRQKSEFMRYTKMKKYTWLIRLVVIAVLSISCFVFWRQNGVERTRMATLCQSNMYQS